jgi:hypothetical protein
VKGCPAIILCSTSISPLFDSLGDDVINLLTAHWSNRLPLQSYLPIALLLFYDLVITFQDGFAHLLVVINHVFQNGQMTKVNALVDKIVTKSVLTLLQVVNLSFGKPFYALDEFCEIAFLNGLHEKSLLINELFFLLLLLEEKHGLVLLKCHLVYLLFLGHH